MLTTTAAATAGTLAATASAASATAAGMAAAGTAAAAGAAASVGAVASTVGSVAAGTAAAAGSGLFTMSNAMMAASALSGLAGVYGSIQSAKQQKEQAKYQSAVAQQNAELAEENASAARRQGYEGMIEHRQKVARMIGSQRANMGASGAAVDVGSSLDVQADTAAQGEMDALKVYQQGLDKAYNYDIQATNYANHANAYNYTANKATSTGLMNATSSAIGGIADMGTTWYKVKALSNDRTRIHGSI